MTVSVNGNGNAEKVWRHDGQVAAGTPLACHLRGWRNLKSKSLSFCHDGGSSNRLVGQTRLLHTHTHVFHFRIIIHSLWTDILFLRFAVTTYNSFLTRDMYGFFEALPSFLLFD